MKKIKYSKPRDKLSLLPNIFIISTVLLSLFFIIWYFNRGDHNQLSIQSIINSDVQDAIKSNKSISFDYKPNSFITSETSSESNLAEITTKSYDSLRVKDTTYYLSLGCQDLSQSNPCQFISLNNLNNEYISIIENFGQELLNKTAIPQAKLKFSPTNNEVKNGKVFFVMSSEVSKDYNTIELNLEKKQIDFIREFKSKS